MFKKIHDGIVIITIVYACKGLLDFAADLLYEGKQLLTK